jgi:small subunit ribosomal protein S20
VAHSLSAKKRIRQNEKRRARNRERKEHLKIELKAFNAVLTAGDFAKADEQLKKVVQRLDRTAAKHVIHKNAASRKRSRLTRKLNVLRSKKVEAGAGTSGAKKA